MKVALETINPNEISLLWDMDGTMAHIFVPGYLSKIFYPDFFLSLEPYPSTIEAIKYIHEKRPDIKQFSCSSLTPTEYCEQEKDKWLDIHLGEEILPKSRRIFVPDGESKADFIPGPITKNLFLVDDYTLRCMEIRDAGGIAMKYRNKINCINGVWDGIIVNGLADGETLAKEILHNIDKTRNNIRVVV